mmetsp:Transcript_14866/g.28757  ORF Transcript_14866/g.28757 Transcript_14866/m.28757 type:complete len:341 (+) Transcript_14866:237-1259(+)
MNKTKVSSVLLALVLASLGTCARATYQVKQSEVKSPHNALLFTPQGTGNETFPAIIFAHGLCGPAKLYTEMLKTLAGNGYVVMANQEQEICQSPSIWNPFSVFSSIGNLRAQSDGKTMVDHIMEEVEFLRGRDDTLEEIALVGHSMGGGAVIDAAAKLEGSDPGLVKALVAIAPWNGITKTSTPSDVASEISAPMLIICSENDQICPCSGEIGLATGFGRSWMSDYALEAIFYTQDHTWKGGVEAIFKDAEEGDANTTLIKFHNGGHFALAGISDSQLEALGKQMTSGSGLGGFANIFINSGSYAMLPFSLSSLTTHAIQLTDPFHASSFNSFHRSYKHG